MPEVDLAVAAGTRSLDAGPAIIEVIFPGLDVLVYALGHMRESSLDVLATLSARLDILKYPVTAGPGFGLSAGHLAAQTTAVGGVGLGEVGFVPNEDDDDVGFGNLAEVVEPVGYVLESLPPCEVEDEESARRTAEVGAGDRLVSLLTGGVPERELHVLLLGLGASSLWSSRRLREAVRFCAGNFGLFGGGGGGVGGCSVIVVS